MKRIDLIIIFLIAVFSVITLKDLFIPGFYTSHDGINQVVRLYYFDKLIKDNQIPPRYAGEMFNGFGYPLFSYSYHMPWIMAEPLHLLGLSVIDSIKGVFLLGFLLSGITMFIFQKKLYGRLPAIVGTAIYLFAPNRFLNIFVRAAIGDATAYIFPPLIFLSIYMFSKEKNINWFWIMVGSLSMGALILSHAMVFFLFYIFILLYCLFTAFSVKNRSIFIKNLFLLNFFGFAVAAYYFIPSLLERSYTIFSGVMGAALIANPFTNITDLIYSKWGYGTVGAKEGGMSLQIGISQLISVIISIPLLLYSLFKKGKKSSQFKNAVFFLLTFILTVFLMLPYSKTLWDLLRPIAIVDFAWRIFPVTIFAVSILAAYVVSSVGKFKVFMAFIIVIIAIYANRNHTRINQVQDWPVSFYIKLEKTTNIADEYTPVWAQRNLIKKQVVKKVEYTDNKAFINVTSNKSNYLSANVNASASGLIKINTVYYPGWKTYVNGKNVKLNYESSGFMEIPLTPGNWHVEAKFQETPLRLISDLVSVASVLLIVTKVYHDYKNNYLKGK